MSAASWSWVAAAASILGLWLSGVNPRVGWVYGLGSQSVWIAYGVATHQLGMLALSAAFLVLYSRNLYRWRGTRFQRKVSDEGIRAGGGPGVGPGRPSASAE